MNRGKTYYKLLRYKKVTELFKKHYNKAMTYAGFWREFIIPYYPISYSSFIKILDETNINGKIKELEVEQMNNKGGVKLRLGCSQTNSSEIQFEEENDDFSIHSGENDDSPVREGENDDSPVQE
jgi:hypothetical protein